MAKQSEKVFINPTVKAILRSDPEMAMELVIKKAQAAGVTADEGKIKVAVQNNRSVVRKELAAGTAVHVRAKKVVAAPAPAVPAPSPVPQMSTADMTTAIANIALVGDLVIAVGEEKILAVLEAIRMCGGLGQFSQVVNLVAKLKG